MDLGGPLDCGHVWSFGHRCLRASGGASAYSHSQADGLRADAEASGPSYSSICPGATPSPVQAVVKLKAGSLGVLADAGNMIADKKGYFKEQAIDVEFFKFDTGAKQVAPLGTGELDVGRGAISAGLFNAMLRGIDIKIVADANTNPSQRGDRDYAAVVVRKDLADQIKTEKDLKGRNLALVGKGIGAEIELQKLLEKGGLANNDVNVQYMGMPDGVAALAGKSIDVYVGLSEPFLTQGLEKGVGVYWKGFSEVYPGHVQSVLMFSAKFASEQRDVAMRYTVAYVRGVRDYYDAFFRNKNKNDVVSILADSTNMKDLALYDKIAPQNINPDGYVSKESIAGDIKWFYESKQIDKELDVSKVVDDSFVESALQKLGKYQ